MKRIKHTYTRLVVAALLATTPLVVTEAQAMPVTAAAMAGTLIPVPSLPAVNPFKLVGQVLGLVGTSDKDVKNGKKVDPSYKFKATKVVNGGQTFKKELTNDKADQNVVLVQKKGKGTFKGATLVKTGDSTAIEKSLSRGRNAALLIAPYSQGEIKSVQISTNGTGASGIVVSGKESRLKGQSVTVATEGAYARGLDVAYEGRMDINGGTVRTGGNYSPALAIDREGGIMNVTGVNLRTEGTVSPLIYTTDAVTLTNSTGQAARSEIAMIEGRSEVVLTRDRLTGAGNTGFMLYQSDMGIAKDGVAKLTVKDSDISLQGEGPLLTVHNTKSQVTLENTKISMPNSATLAYVGAGPWGESGRKGAELSLKTTNQTLTGDIKADSQSKVQVKMSGTNYTGAINSDGQAKQMELTLSKDSVWNVTDDSRLSKLNNEDKTNRNIHTNGHTVTVGNSILK
ncbi:MAG: hypothetical protein KHZ77_03975 [Veillonella sp.]|uniref:hypothetical protein n=1 Tax=Veillonella sp. TaxID=1926307 RepID=UPI0025DD7C4B|nr:hypothetical protein [Veillonella sp.]MBS4913307.1 hypothetical protein [Veillonella sp.]